MVPPQKHPGGDEYLGAPGPRGFCRLRSVLAAQDVVAAQPQPYEEVRREIAEKVLDVKIQKAVEEYAEKLRALSDVRVYLKAS